MAARRNISILEDNIGPEIIANLEKIINVNSSPIKRRKSKRSMYMHDAMTYMCLPPGRLWRPKLLWSVAQGYNVKRDLALSFAAMVEAVHSASLAEDDRRNQDFGIWRRGKDSCWRHFANIFEELGDPFGKAMNNGDMVTGAAVHKLVDNVVYSINEGPGLKGQRRTIVSEFLGTKGLLLEGQISDVCLTQSFESKDDFIDFYVEKTGVLFALATCVGARLRGGRGVRDVDKWRKLGINLGVAYQLSDDLLEKRKVEAADKSVEDYRGKKSIFEVAEVGEVINARRNAMRIVHTHLNYLGAERFSAVGEMVDYMDSYFRERFNSAE